MPIKPLNKTRMIAVVASLSALSVATSYAMLPLPNIKLMDTIIFVAGFCFGAVPGIIVAFMTWLIYGTLNPLGLSLPVLLTVMFAETIYALAGWILSTYMRKKPSSSSTEHFIMFGVAGLFMTLAYDLVTNAVCGWLFYDSVWVGLLTMNFPVPMGLIHEASNLMFFGLVVPLLIRAVKSFLLR